MGGDNSEGKFHQFLGRLQPYMRPHLGSVDYGNLRCEVCDGSADADEPSNVAIVYETPGGSTDQINIGYDQGTGTFHLVHDEREVVETDSDRVFELVRRQIRAIPGKRLASLRVQADNWLNEGRSRGQMFAELNRILQSGLRGGSITVREMREVVKYIVEKHEAGRNR